MLSFFRKRRARVEKSPVSEEREARQREHEQRVREARPLLTGESWKDPEGKVEFVEKIYGGKKPKYLWYFMDSQAYLSADEAQCFIKTFWPEQGPHFGDFELHASENFPGKTVVRVRNPTMVVAEVVVGENRFPLYQVGHATAPEPRISFPCLWD